MDAEWVGAAAAVLTTAAYVPQVLKVWRDKHTRSISLGMYCMLSTGIGLWCLYGFLLGSYSLIIANGISCLLTLSILFFKIRHG